MKKRYIFIIIFIFLLCIIFISILNKKAMPAIITYANVETKKIGIEVLRNVGTNDVKKLLDGKELFKISRNNKGDIDNIDFNTTLINESLVVIAKNVRKRLIEIEEGKNLPEELYYDTNIKNKKGIVFEVPMGVAFNNAFTYNLGPKIPVRIKYSGNVALDVKTRISEYGINNALIEVFIYIEVTQTTILPFQSDEVKLSSEIPIIMKVVRGEVPSYISGYNHSYSLPIN